jgi:hypothetical protein
MAELEGRHFHRGNPSLALGQALFGLVSLMLRPFAPAEVRAVSLASRLRAFPLYFEGVRRTLERADLPEAWRERALREIEGGRLLLARVGEWGATENLPASLQHDLARAVPLAAEALAWFGRHLQARPAAPAARYAAGGVMLELLLRRGHEYEGAVDQLRHEAREELQLESRHLANAISMHGASSWAEIADRLSHDRPHADGFLGSLGDTWVRARDFAMERELVTWPDYAIRYVPLPAWAREAAPFLYFLFYRSPAPFDQPLVVDYFVPAPADAPDDASREAILRAWNTAAIKLNHVLHHGGLGHHVQNWYAQRAGSRVGRIAAVDGANRIGMFCGGTMAEGWACYATDLMEEAGFLTPLERVAQQHTQVRLLARAIVDIEMHAGRMSFDEAVRVYVDQVGLSPAAARAEAVKNSMFPATALMYWLGLREIWRLRAAEEDALGAAFSMRAFHDELLGFGSIPVPLAARLMAARHPAAAGTGAAG